MKKISYLKSYILGAMFSCLLLLSTNIMAQEKPAEERAHDLTKSMNCELGLFASQYPKINAINLQACLRMDSAREQSNSDIHKYHQIGRKINKDRDIQLRDVLTPDQFSLYERISKGNQAALKKTAVCREDLTIR